MLLSATRNATQFAFRDPTPSLGGIRTATAQHATWVVIAPPSHDKHQDNLAPYGVL